MAGSNNALNLFKQPKALDSQAHRHLRYAPNQPYHFASQQMFSPIVAGEAAMVAREYAIVFSDIPGSLPLALLGASQGINAYVRPSGHWTARYVPAHVRRYPFVMAEAVAETQGEGQAEPAGFADLGGVGAQPCGQGATAVGVQFFVAIGVQDVHVLPLCSLCADQRGACALLLRKGRARVTGGEPGGASLVRQRLNVTEEFYADNICLQVFPAQFAVR